MQNDCYKLYITTDNTMTNSDNNNFLKLLIPNQKRIFSYIVRLIPNYADAEDVMQEVAELLWKKYSEYEPNTDFLAWALAIARFKVYEYYKESKRKQQRLSNETVRILEKEAQSQVDKEDDRIEAIKDCVIKLSSNDYNIVKLRYELNEKVKNIAARYGCSVQSVYNNLTRIHEALMLCIKRHMRQES